MTGSCPILFENKQEEYGLTDKEVEKFCQEGCSVDCDILLKQYAERVKKRKENKKDVRERRNYAYTERGWNI